MNITDSLGLDPTFKDVGIHKTPENKIDTAVKKYKDHPSIIAIKRKIKVDYTFEFRFVTLLNVMTKIEALKTNKPSSDNLPTKIIQEAKGVICPYLTDSINAAMDNCVFPEKLKEAEVRAIYKKGDPCQISNFWPISILSALSKIFERIISEQVNQFMASMLNPLLSGFRRRVCPLIWLFCSKTANNDINRTHKRALRILYRDYESSFEELLERDNTKTIHTKNIQKLMIEVYKSLNHLNPEYMWEFFVKKDVQYNLRTKELCKLPSVSSQRYGLNSLSFRGSLLWNTIDDEIKLSPSLEVFKKKIRSWNGISCTCFICN